jgi:hypothetical protein
MTQDYWARRGWPLRQTMNQSKRRICPLEGYDVSRLQLEDATWQASGSEPGADRGPRASNSRGVVDATGSLTQLEWPHPVATAPGSVTVRLDRTV